MNIRRFILSTALLGAAFLLPLGSAYSQTATATTVPVGYQQVTVAAATNALLPTSTVVSVPFYNSAVYAGIVTSVDGANTLSSSAATWMANQFAAAASPYLIHFKSGNSVGRYFLITANTGTQLTIASRGYNLTSVSAASDSFEIIQAFTLGTLFGSTSVPFQTGSSALQSDNILLWNGLTWDAYYHNGTNWKKSASLLNQNNTILYPDEGLYIIRRATSALNLTFLGTVSSTAERSDLVGPGTTFVSNRFPVDTTLNSVGFQNLPNWQSGSSASQADDIYLWNGTTWNAYYYNGTNWRRAASLLNFDTQPILSGTAMLVIRQSTATGINGTLTQSLPYSLN